MQPTGDRTCEPGDVRSERRVVLGVIGGVVANDVHDRRGGAAGIVQIGEPVGQTRPEVEEGRRWALGHAPVPVGHSGDDALEQGEHGPHPLDSIDRRDEMHLRRAGIGETHVDVTCDECP